ncbi:MAG: hypothetical protein ACYTHJ_04670 [Planctomycetota bacterium]|jgi:hypothetical protein
MNNRKLLGAAFFSLTLASTSFAQNWGSGSGGVEADGRPSSKVVMRDASFPVVQLLAKEVKQVDWEDITFDEVLNWLRDEGDSKINVVPRWSSLNQVGIDEDKTLSKLTLFDTTVAEVLTEVLDELGSGSGANVTYQGERNTIRISTAADFDSKLILRVYDVTDILFRVPDFSESAPQVDLSRQTNTGGGGGGGGQPIFANAGGQSQDELSEEGDQDPEQILDNLVDLIRDTVDPLNWNDTAGGPHRVRGYGRRSLVIYAPISIHEQIVGYFSRIR